MIGFKRHLRAEVVPGDAVYLLSEHDATALRSPHLEPLAPLLDGTRDLAALRRDLPAGTPAEPIAGLLTNLAEAGLVALRQPFDPDTDEAALAYWEASGLDADEAGSNLAGGRVGLITVGVESAPAADALRAAGLTIHPVTRDDLGATDVSVVLCDDYLADGLADVDTAHRVDGRPWLLAKPVGTRVWVGPVFTPGSGACWHCLAGRLWGNRPAEAHVRDSLGLNGAVARPMVTIAALTATALNLVALEAAKWLAGQRYPGQQGVWTLDSRDLSGRHHELRARPQCAACGDPLLVRRQARQPVALGSRPKAYTTSGGHRAVSPEQTMASYRHLISPVTGVVKEIRRDPRGPAFLNSYRSGPNVALGTRGADRLRSALRSENGGKGVTPLHAEVSALCEALERHCGFYHGDEERVPASFRSLGDRAVHPDSCQLFHQRQYPDRTRWNAVHSVAQYVCDPFDDDAVLDWTPVWSLTQQRQRLLPTGMLYFCKPIGRGPVHVLADSNGNAAGTSLEDAVLQGMCELVERDAVALWWYNRTPRPGVDLDAFGDPWIAELREVYAGLGREVWVLDVTSDLGVPAMVALSRRAGVAREDIMFGFGAHLDPAIALRRALTELNQLMPVVVDATPDGGYGWDDPDALHWWEHGTVANQPYLVPDPARPMRGPPDYGYESDPDLNADVRTIQERMEAAGLEVLVLNQTRPDIDLPVVKVIVPGMRGFWARFAPGRLYDVPVQLGRLSTPTAYDQLNPMPLFF